MNKIIDTVKWNKRYMELAEFVSNWSTCHREDRKIGAVIVKNNRIVTVGYNGAPTGVKNCMERGECMRQKLKIESGTKQEICYSVCAERNAIIQAAKLGHAVEGATLYSTHHPCSICAREIILSGIEKVYYKMGYPDEFSVALFKEAGVPVIKYTGDIK